jgi:hypothetical protein
MEIKNQIELRDDQVFPDETVLRQVLENAFQAYLGLLDIFRRQNLSAEWRYYHDGKAWLLKVQKKQKTLVWMSAWKGFISATIYLPLKHLDRFSELDIDDSIKEKVEQSKDIMKSKPCTFEISEVGILDDFEKVLKLKMELK